MEKYVCSFKLAKKLKELGVKQESHYFWQETGSSLLLVTKYAAGCCQEVQKTLTINYYSAYTVAELGEMLPEIDGITAYPIPEKIDGTWSVWHDRRY